MFLQLKNPQHDVLAETPIDPRFERDLHRDHLEARALSQSRTWQMPMTAQLSRTSADLPRPGRQA